MEKIVLYTHPQSRGRNVVWMLEECGAEYETVLMNFGEDLHSPAYLAVNSMGKLPALKYGDTVITEASAIITFLADLFPQAQLAPAQVDGQRGERCPAAHDEADHAFGLDGVKAEMPGQRGNRRAGAFQRADHIAFDRAPEAGGVDEVFRQTSAHAEVANQRGQ